MATRPGEELVAILFADVHYYYGPPTSKPPHHRFDKASYLYLFEKPSYRRARVEIANNAGTPDQDAFSGHLDSAHVNYSYKHSNLVTLTVDGQSRRSIGSPPLDGQEWHLPTFDPRNENKYMYKLHTLDIYFWLKEDALQFVNGVRRVLPQQQITILDEPIAPPPHQHDMSPVVQKLENVAITDPSYQQGQTRNSQTLSASRLSNTTFPGPPVSATPQSTEASNFVPLAYNPAAPAAPEAIQHREKTPPLDDGTGNPLVAAANSDQGQTYAPPSHAPQQSYFPGPPAANTPSSRFSQPPQSVGLQSQFGHPHPPPAGLQSPYAQHSFTGPPTAPTASSPFSQPPSAAATAPPPYHPSQQLPTSSAAHIPVTQQYAQYPISPGLSSTGLSSPGVYSPMQPPSSFSPSAPAPAPPSAPPGGFSNYQYNPHQLSHTQPLMNDYSIHHQVYRPTEGEVAVKNKPVKAPTGKLEQRAGQLEKGVGNLLKKLEKRMG